MIARHHLLALLAECTGDEIWSVDHCRQRRVPEAWITEFADALESGFDNDMETIYTDDGVVNQYHGVKDVDLAIRIAKELGIEIDTHNRQYYSRAHLVQTIKNAVEEL
ncbi:hypothetical protein U8335_09590 [Roseiconus lacunae]|uniref:Uncharacterized protein n=1 Tax=Roseiconus lacunae TaxID=2605694 RepID=A0ABT7PGC3_9BACT|nr:hypothetical protein [Roseiconus lacunae]MCD0460414.1 hypothetical protein [Roseiconus lacunae]MDM4015539.1 hypothetical protein [Roseiconus lacunae]WRQ52784.1 hypothetical protein U8335_09590 [Stieleria sp. HD01]